MFSDAHKLIFRYAQIALQKIVWSKQMLHQGPAFLLCDHQSRAIATMFYDSNQTQHKQAWTAAHLRIQSTTCDGFTSVNFIIYIARSIRLNEWNSGSPYFPDRIFWTHCSFWCICGESAPYTHQLQRNLTLRQWSQYKRRVLTFFYTLSFNRTPKLTILLAGDYTQQQFAVQTADKGETGIW